MNRMHDLERGISPSRAPRSAKATSVPPKRPAAVPAGPSVTFAMSFDDGAPIIVRRHMPSAPKHASAASTSAPHPTKTKWRDLGAVSEAGYAEPLEEYEHDAAPPEQRPSSGRPAAEDESDAARLVQQEQESSPEAQESRAFAQEIERLLAQAKGASADGARGEVPAPPPPARRGPPGDTPADHPHRIFDQMSFANAFDAGTVDLDGVERDAIPRPRKQPRIQSFGATGALDAMDVAEDLALIRAQETTKHYEIAPDAVVTAEIEARIAPIADAYFAETGRNIYITSAKRAPLAQARAMYVKLEAGDDLSIYRNTTAAAEIKKAYADKKAAGATEAEIIRAMCDVIQAQVDAGTHISRHLFAGAVDVRSHDMTADEKAAFERAVRAQKNVSLLDEGKPPHFHLEFR